MDRTCFGLESLRNQFGRIGRGVRPAIENRPLEMELNGRETGGLYSTVLYVAATEENCRRGARSIPD